MNDEIATNLAGERLATGHMSVPATNAQQEPVRAGVVSTLHNLLGGQRARRPLRDREFTGGRAAAGKPECSQSIDRSLLERFRRRQSRSLVTSPSKAPGIDGYAVTLLCSGPPSCAPHPVFGATRRGRSSRAFWDAVRCAPPQPDRRVGYAIKRARDLSASGSCYASTGTAGALLATARRAVLGREFGDTMRL